MAMERKSEVGGRRRGVMWAIWLALVVLVGAWLALGTSWLKAPRPKASSAPPQRSGTPVAAAFMYPPGSEAGVVEGDVRDAAGKAIAGAVVSVVPQLNGQARFRDWLREAHPRQVRTDEQGHYRIEDVAPGALSLTASARGFKPGVREPVALKPGENLTGVDLKLEAGGVRLYGRVSDSGGGPVPAARILAATGNKNPKDPGTIIFQTQADADGAYEIFLEPTWYEIRVAADGYAPDHGFVFIETETQRDVRLHPASRIVGQVRDEAGAPVADATVTVRGMTVMAAPPDVTTDGDGRFDSGALDPGAYSLVARKGTLVGKSDQTVTVPLGQTITSDLVLGPGVTLAGHVTDEHGKPIADARIYDMGRNVTLSARGVQSPPDARSDAEGHYVLRGVLGPDAPIRAEAEGFGVASRFERGLLSDRTDVDFRLKAGATLVLTVLTASGAPIQGATAVVVGTERVMGAPPAYRSAPSPSDTDGRLVVEGAPAGRVELIVNAKDHGSLRRDDIVLAAGQRLELTVKLGGEAKVSGKVVWSDGTPAKNVPVMAQGKAGGGRASTDASGGFEIGKLGAGTYSLFARIDDGSGMINNLDRRAMADVMLAAGETRTGVKLTLARTDLSIEGIVLDPDGQPISGAQVGAIDVRGARFGGCQMAYRSKLVSDPDGRFTIDKLAAGQYGVCAQAPGLPEAKVLDVTAGTRGVQVRVERAGRITGIVLDRAGRPVAGAEVAAFHRQPEDADAPLAEFKTRPTVATSRADGTFLIEPLHAAVWDLMARVPDGGKGLSPRVLLKAGATVRDVRIQVQAGVTLMGRLVHAETGAPLSDIDVYATSDQPVRTDGKGSFRVADVPRGAKVSVSFQPGRSSGILPDALEAWVPKDAGDTFDVGTFKLAAGDAESAFFNAEAQAGLRVRHEGGSAVVTGLDEGSHAAASGVKVRDRVLAIDGKPIEGLGQNALKRLLSGPEGQAKTVRLQTGSEAPRNVKIPLLRY